MNSEKYLDQIIDQNIISQILNPTKDSFPLGNFKNYSEIPLGWTKGIKFSDFKKQYKSFDLYEKYVFIGMGGSISMSKIASFINPKKILFLDNFDISNISKIKETIAKPTTAVFICSKSGNTLETKILNKIVASKKRDKFIITDTLSKSHNVLNTPKDIGGRFSITTHLGILPFYLIGFDLQKIETQINKANSECRINNSDNPAIKIASILHYNFNQNQKIFSITSISKNDYISSWVEQLISESTGKQESGIIPIKDFNFFSPNINFSKSKNEFKEKYINLRINYDESIFYSFQILLYAISIFCSLIKIQPFDQPNVESTKLTTKKLLENENTEILNSLKKSNINQIKNHLINNKNISCLLIHSTNLNLKLKEKLIKKVSDISNTGEKILVFFAPNYLHSMGQLLKGSYKDIQNLVINLHGNEDLNIPNSLYTLNTFVKKQGYSDHLELKKNGRKSLYFETTYEELMNNLNRLIDD
ncbi:MAG: hypothetical protein VX523_03585 [Chloroflexota bacterium]|nr:hypothetical protein [Chloroflexota bacterium]